MSGCIGLHSTISERMTHSIISCLACRRAMPRKACLKAASSSLWLSCLGFTSAFIGAVGGGVEAPIAAGVLAEEVAHG